ncbi:MAG: molybdate ABC transporter substrate-binding protein [Actinobacteria bacterium]|nr:molybdate ABC transporter substrate-binding protein [Actinomycetota bacterium]
MIARRKSALICSLTLIVTLFPTSPAVSATTKQKVSLTIFAASSLSGTFTKIGALFERDNPGISLKFSFLASSVLASQIADGAPADVFAAASSPDMMRAKKLVLAPKIFATNTIVLAHPRSNRDLVATFSDLNKKSVKWVQCASTVACGVATDSALKSLRIVITRPVSYEPNVASVVSKLLAGEVDAAFIYHSDYLANRNKLREVAFPNPLAATTNYPIALVRQSKHRVASQKFLIEIFSPRSRKILSTAGFGVAR